MPIPKTYFAALRVHLAVRGRRAHRRQVGHHPDRHRRVRPAVPAAGRPGLGRGPLRHPDRRRSTPPTSTRRASPPAPPTTSPATRACARPRLEALAGLKPVARPDGVHTAGTSSQISDGAAAVLMMTAEQGRRARASRPGPGSSTPASSASTRCSCSPARSTPPSACSSAPAWRIADIDVVEINEAFASVVLAWQRELGCRPRPHQPQRRRHRPRPPARRHRRVPHDQGPPRARAHRRLARPSSPCAAAAASAPAPSSSALAPAAGARPPSGRRGLRHRTLPDRGRRPPRPMPSTPGVPSSTRATPRSAARARAGVAGAVARGRGGHVPAVRGPRPAHGRRGHGDRSCEVVDGDTVWSTSAAATEHGPPHRHRHARDRRPRPPVECFGAEASHHLAELLPPGTAVRLERDVEARDRYDRLLAYVYRADDGLFVNLAQVAGGFAEPLAYPPNIAHRADFERAERRGAATARRRPVAGMRRRRRRARRRRPDASTRPTRREPRR